MKKNSYSTIIDFGSSQLRLAVFDKKISKLLFQSKQKIKNKNSDEYLKSVNILIREAESRIADHLENIIVLYDSPNIFTIDLSIRKKLDRKIIFEDACSSIILEANRIIKDCYISKRIIHLIIKKYIINDEEFFNIPDKLPKLNSLILEIKFVCLPYNEYQKVFEIFKNNNLKISHFFSCSLVKSFKYIELFKENKSVAFLDIGLNRTSITFFNNQKLDSLNSIPIGGNHISKDISQIMKLSIDESENIKKAFNKSEVDFSYNETNSIENINIINNINGKNISIDLLKKVVLTRVEEIIELSFKGINISKNIKNKKNLNLVLIGNGSKILNKNSFQIEDKYNFKEINFYEENDLEICEAGLKFKENSKEENSEKLKKNQNTMGFFHRFFNFFGNS